MPAEPARAGRAETTSPVGSELSAGPRLEIARELRVEWLRLVASLRRAAQASVELDAPPGRIKQLADRVAEIARELQAHASGRPVPLRHVRPNALAPDGLNAARPFSPVMGRYNPLAPPIDVTLQGDRVIASVRLQAAYQGEAGLVHGGVVAAIFDEVLGMSASLQGTPGSASSLKVDYRRPIPLRADLRFEAWVDRVQRRRVHARGKCLADGVMVAEAEATFTKPSRPSGWTRLRGTSSFPGTSYR